MRIIVLLLLSASVVSNSYAAIYYLPHSSADIVSRTDNNNSGRTPIDPYAGKTCSDYGLLSSSKESSLYICANISKGPLSCYGSCKCLSKFKYDSSNCASLQGKTCDGKYEACCTDTCQNFQHESIPDGYEESGRCTDCEGKLKYSIKPKDCGSGYQTCSNGPDVGAKSCKSGELTYYNKCKPDTITCTSPQVSLESYWCEASLQCFYCPGCHYNNGGGDNSCAITEVNTDEFWCDGALQCWISN